MQQLNRNLHKAPTYPEKVLQFGGGNFLRAFVDAFIQELNEHCGFKAGVVLVKPTPRGSYDTLEKQEGLFTLFLKGIKNGQARSEHKIIDCIQRIVDPYQTPDTFLKTAHIPELRFVFSNTTEAGITYRDQDQFNDAPPLSFPGKLTALLYERFKHFNGQVDKGLIIIPCELIEDNGTTLKEIVRSHALNWNLGTDFIDWVEEHSIFCNTLVDRIVPGFPKDDHSELSNQLGYVDELMVVGEYFNAWIIEGPKQVQDEFPLHHLDINAIFTQDLAPYRKRKVRILNGAHTVLVPIAYLYGLRTVRASIEDPIVGNFLNHVLQQEIVPSLAFPRKELETFTKEVLDRFKNPYMEHQLISIALNSISKYKTRVLPSLLDHVARSGKLPKGLVFALAALIVFYKGHLNGEAIALNDDGEVIKFFETYWAMDNIPKLVTHLLANTSFWEADLTQIKGLVELTTRDVESIEEKGMKYVLNSLTSEQTIK